MSSWEVIFGLLHAAVLWASWRNPLTRKAAAALCVVWIISTLAAHFWPAPNAYAQYDDAMVVGMALNFVASLWLFQVWMKGGYPIWLSALWVSLDFEEILHGLEINALKPLSTASLAAHDVRAALSNQLCVVLIAQLALVLIGPRAKDIQRGVSRAIRRWRRDCRQRDRAVARLQRQAAQAADRSLGVGAKSTPEKMVLWL